MLLPVSERKLHSTLNAAGFAVTTKGHRCRGVCGGGLLFWDTYSICLPVQVCLIVFQFKLKQGLHITL